MNSAAFYYGYKDAQVNTLIGSTSIIYNGAKADIYGLDVDTELVLTEHLSFIGGFTVLHDRWTNFPSAVISTINPDGTSSLTVGSAEGNRLPYAPDATVSVGATYKTTIANGLTQFNVNELYSTGYYTQPDNIVHQGAYDELGASMSWSPENSRYTLKLYATNLLDIAVLSYGGSNGAGLISSYEPPRVVGGSVSLRSNVVRLWSWSKSALDIAALKNVLSTMARERSWSFKTAGDIENALTSLVAPLIQCKAVDPATDLLSVFIAHFFQGGSVGA